MTLDNLKSLSLLEARIPSQIVPARRQTPPKPTVPKVEKEYRASWSELLRHNDIKVHQRIAKRTGKTNPGGGVCLLVEGLVKSPAWSIAFKPLKCGGPTHIGICLKNTVLRDKYSYEGFGSSNHGHYVLEKDGAFSAHSGLKPGFTFGFGEAETVRLEYDAAKGSLQFWKGKDHNFKVEVPKPPKDDCFYPCVYLGNLNDAVELV